MSQSRLQWFGLTIVGGALVVSGGCGGASAPAPAAAPANGAGVRQMGNAAGIDMPGAGGGHGGAVAAAPSAPSGHGGGAMPAPSAAGGHAGSSMQAAAAAGGQGSAVGNSSDPSAAMAASINRGSAAGGHGQGGASSAQPQGSAAASHAQAAATGQPGAGAHGQPGASSAPVQGSAAASHAQTAAGGADAIGQPGDAAAIAAATAANSNPDPANPGSTDATGLNIGIGASGEGGQGGQAQIGPKGSIDYAIQMLMQMAKKGDYAEAGEVISDKAKGIAGDIRANKLSEEQIESYKTAFELTPLGSRNLGTGIQVTAQNKDNKVFTFVVVKEGAIFRIKDVKITDGKKK